MLSDGTRHVDRTGWPSGPWDQRTNWIVLEPRTGADTLKVMVVASEVVALEDVAAHPDQCTVHLKGGSSVVVRGTATEVQAIVDAGLL